MSTREVRTKNGKKRISQEVKMEIVREYYLEGQHNQPTKKERITHKEGTASQHRREITEGIISLNV